MIQTHSPQLLVADGDVIVNPRLTNLVVDLDRACRRLAVTQGELIAVLALVLRGVLNASADPELPLLVAEFVKETDPERQSFVWTLLVSECGVATAPCES